MVFLIVEHLLKKYGKIIAVNDVTFKTKKGEFITLLGPSGCGKTTILRCIGGLEKPERGEISIDGKIVTSIEKNIFLPPEKRNIGMVFQSYTVWPHMTVEENVKYGLLARKLPKNEINRRVNNVLSLVDLKKLAKRPVTDLSGGQQQRVAIARALAYNPNLLLFDEPFSNLDTKLREKMIFELKRLQKFTKITSIYVTHDQIEAMYLSDKILIMKDGKIIQEGSPIEVYKKPKTPFVADFLGGVNFIKGRFRGLTHNKRFIRVELQDGNIILAKNPSYKISFKQGRKILLTIRPQHVKLFLKHHKKLNFLEGKITSSVFLGTFIEYSIKLVTGEILKVISPPSRFVRKSRNIFVFINPNRLMIFF